MAKGKNFTPSWHMEVGMNHTPAYQVSGIPFASGGIDATGTTQELPFPYVTRWVEVYNNGATALKVGFSKNGIDAPGAVNYFLLPGAGSSGRLELKISRLYLNGGNVGTVSVVAGLTSIRPQKIALSGAAGPVSKPSWSGSAGVA